LKIVRSFLGHDGTQRRLNVIMPALADAVLESVRLMANAVEAFTDFCLTDMEANAEACEAAVEQSLSLVTGLNLHIGYERAAALAKEAFAEGKTIRELCLEKDILPKEQLDDALAPWRTTRPRP